MKNYRGRLDRLEKRRRRGLPDIGAALARVAEIAPVEDRTVLLSMANNWRTGGRRFRELLRCLSDVGLSALAAAKEFARLGGEPAADAPLMDALANDGELSASDRETCRKLAGELRAGRIDLETALMRISDAALARASIVNFEI